MKDERITEIGIAPRPASDFWFACVDIEVVRDPELSPIDKTVFAVICSHAGTTTRQSLLKVKTIAAEAGCSDRSVQRSLRALEERGVVETCPRSMDGHRIASIYRIVGHRAPCYAAAPAPKDAPQLPIIEPEADDVATDVRGVATQCHHRGDTVSPRINENILNERETKDRPEISSCEEISGARPAAPPPRDAPNDPSGAPEEEAPQDLLPLTEAPEIMRSTAELLLLKTGRAGLSEEDVRALRTLAARHYPARVQKELAVAVERFRRRGRPLAELDFAYIADALSRQASRPGRSGPTPRGAPPRGGEDTSDLDAAVLRTPEGGAGGSP